MAAVDDLDEAVEQWMASATEFVKGNPEPQKKLFSRREDVTLNNPFGPPARGWEQVDQALERAASGLRDGQIVDVETVVKYVAPELAYVVEVERLKAKVGGSEKFTPFALRATMIFRPEEDTWKVVHLHGDPITTAQPAESVIQQ